MYKKIDNNKKRHRSKSNRFKKMRTEIYRKGSTFIKVENYFCNTDGYAIPIDADYVYVSMGFVHALEMQEIEDGEWHHAINENDEVVKITMTQDILDNVTVA